MEKYREYKLPLWIAFVDYEKAFDSVETNAVINALINQGINNKITKLLKEIYDNTTTSITLFDKDINIQIKRGIRQGDPLSPKLFNAALEEVFRNLNWISGLNINGDTLNHLRFADDIVLLGNTSDEIKRKLIDLNRESKKIGLKINMSKTKVMSNQNEDLEIEIDDTKVEIVNEYVYLGQVINQEHSRKQELSKRKRQHGQPMEN